MKIKKIVLMLFVSVLGFLGMMDSKAVTIAEDGKYVLILNTIDGDINGSPNKIIKFNFDAGETSVELATFTKGIVPFNGVNEFAYWAKNFFGDERAPEVLKESDFNTSGTVGEFEYTNGLVLWAKFSDKPLKGSGTYYVSLDAFAGTVNGEEILKLTTKDSEFKTIDLTNYKPVRKGYTFVGWDYNSKFITSIDNSYFKESDVVTVTAVYTKDSFEGDFYVLNLNANGGKIAGEDIKKYDYVGGANSGTSMPIFHYIPERSGYTFKGWNTKKDGSGKSLNYIYWRAWFDTKSTEYDGDTIINDAFKNITLYAIWEKDASFIDDTVKSLDSTSDIKGNIEFTNGINKNYKLSIENVIVNEILAKKNVKFIADINVLDGSNVIKIDNTKLKIKLALPENLKGYKHMK